MAYCYILRCADGSYYVGSTHDIAARFVRHQEGSASRHTAIRRPVALEFVEEFATIGAARDREKQVKGWTRRKKEALIRGIAGRPPRS